ncbi:MAG: ATP-dependent 6-phosphofructokinase, partial [bacterium]|nr:ATP-dependent 6-phosphofructokinase [bacterium]
MKIGILTGGGDCPGLNAVIRAVVRKGIRQYSYEIMGIKNGWKGLLEGDYIPLDLNSVSGILHRGGTILGTSRTNPFKVENGSQTILDNLKRVGIEYLITIGGDDTLRVGQRFHEMGVKVIGIPKTIDNDLSCTDFSFGFDTAVSVVTEALDRLHTTAESHHRVMVVEVMGRYTGWIATYGGLAGGADLILIPEVPLDIDEICDIIKRRHQRGKDFSIVVIAEGVIITRSGEKGELVSKDGERDAFGHLKLGGIGEQLGKIIEEETGYETRVTVLGHIQRGGSPTSYDRILATRYGVAAIDLVAQGNHG